MATLTSYKNARSARVLQTEAGYKLGCYYTNQEVPESYAKLLVNYEYTDDGQILRPRPGITNDAVLEHSAIDPASTSIVSLGDATIDGLLYFKGLNDKDQLAETVLSYGEVYNFGSTELGIKQGRYFNPNINKTEGNTVIKGSSGWALVLDKRDSEQYLSNPYILGSFKAGTDTENTVGYIRTKNFNNIDIFNTGLSSFTIDRPVTTDFNGALFTICTAGMEENDGVITSADPTFKLAKIELEEREDDAGNTTFDAVRTPVEVYQPNTAEATSVGFNMLLENPYEFPNREGATEAHGLVAYRPGTTEDPLGEVLFTANTGETLRFNLIYSFETGKQYEAQFEYKSLAADDWTVIKAYHDVTVGVDKLIYFDIVPQDTVFSVQVRFRVKEDLSDVQLGINPRFELNVNSLKNLGTELFDLTTATGMFTYSNMIGLYGVEGAETTIFFSDIENPGYFPFPHNIDAFDEYVLKVINYLDILLVITTTSIYTISGLGLPSSFVRKKIITNLNITELDAELIKVIKDQVFFKADNTFFVLKPSTYTSDATDLRAYEVSKAINTYLHNFETNTLKLFNTLYPLRLTEPDLLQDDNALNTWQYNTLVLLGYNQHVVDGRLQIVLRLELRCEDDTHGNVPKYYTNQADLTLTYDTLTKQWSTQVHNILNTGALRHRRIDNQVLLYFDKLINNDKRYLLIAKNTDNPRDYYQYNLADSVDAQDVIVNPKLPNWNMIDTGIINASNTHYKRLRELQFTVNNIAQDNLEFYATVYADGANVLSHGKYELRQVTDTTQPDYGHIYFNLVDEANLLYGGTTLLDAWQLNFSDFPELNLLRTHVLLAGKGRFISGEFINRDELRYEISSTNWVFRIMNAR